MPVQQEQAAGSLRLLQPVAADNMRAEMPLHEP